jgi:polysaccharide biosynthesis/export protein
MLRCATMRESVWAFAVLTSLAMSTLVTGQLSAQTSLGHDPSLPAGMAASQPVIQQTANLSVPGEARLKKDAEPVRIAGGDLLEVNVYGLDDMSQKVRVDSEGEISLQLLGQVHVGDLTTSDAEKLLARLSVEKGILKDPHFSVFIKEDVQGGVSVLGEVNKPGIYQLEGTRHLLEAISAAGGVTNRAGNIVNITRRDNPDQVIKVELRQDGQDPATNIAIFPGDTIVVAKAPLVYVVGEVQRPSGLVMENGERMTVLQAIALAQGTTKTAKLSATRIIRKSPDGQYHEIPLALGDMLKAKKPDVTLQKEDIVFVPTSVSKTVMGTTLQSAVQIAVGAAIYRP